MDLGGIELMWRRFWTRGAVVDDRWGPRPTCHLDRRQGAPTARHSSPRHDAARRPARRGAREAGAEIEERAHGMVWDGAKLNRGSGGGKLQRRSGAESNGGDGRKLTAGRRCRRGPAQE